MTDTITEVDMALMQRTALRAIHPRATITGGRYGTGTTGTLIPRSVVQPDSGDERVHVLLLDEGEHHRDFYRQTPGLWDGVESRFVTLDEVTDESLTPEQILARLPRYTLNEETFAAVPSGVLTTNSNMILAVMPLSGSPFAGWEMDEPNQVSAEWPSETRTGLWGWWLTNRTGTWSLSGNLPSTEPSFEVGQRVTVDEVSQIRGIVLSRIGSGDTRWVTHGDGTASRVSGGLHRSHLGLGHHMPNTDDPGNCWVRDGWTYVGLDESRVPVPPTVEVPDDDPADEDEVTVLRRRLAEAEERHAQDLATISEILGNEAVEREWCSEYESVVTKINRSISGELQPCRDQEATVSVTVRGYARIPWTIDINVPVECRNGEPTSDQVREAVSDWLGNEYVEHASPNLGEAEFDSTYYVGDVEIDDEWEVN
jgi:hypothetical protein